MIRLKVFVSSVQKELRAERIAIGSLLATDDFLRECTVPRIFEDYPAPLQPNPQAYLALLRTCHVYLLVIGREYGRPLAGGLAASHEEYRLARELELPTLVCIKGDRSADREEATACFIAEIEKDHHTYSRFATEEELLSVVRDRLKEHIQATFDTAPKMEQEERSRDNLRSASGYERDPVSSLAFADLDLDLALEMMAAAENVDAKRISREELPRLLHARGYLWWDLATGMYRPTVAGTLLLAAKPALALPQARIQLDAYATDTRETEPVDAVFIEAPLPTAIEQAVAFLRRNTARALAVEGLKRKSADVYPAEALREVLVNAVAHRDYIDPGAKVSVELFADRLLVSSPGLPPGGQRIETIATGQARSRARNPLVVQGLTWLEYMDERGSGIRRMRRALEQAGLPPPRFAIEHDCVTVAFQAVPPATPVAGEKGQAPSVSSETAESALPPEETIRQMFAQVGSITTTMCVQRLGISRDTAWRTLSRMVADGILDQTGSGRGTRYHLKGKP